MHTKKSLARRMIAGGAVVAALAMGPMAVVGQAGAASTTTSSAAGAKTKSAPAVCRGGKTLFKPGHQGKGFEKQVVKLEAKEAKAKKAGHTKRAARLAKMVAHYKAVAAELGKHHAKVEGRISAFVSKKCSTSH